jgi:hypothetical protein
MNDSLKYVLLLFPGAWIAVRSMVEIREEIAPHGPPWTQVGVLIFDLLVPDLIAI